jgi:2-oxoglutarate dehydrogenase E2 component (dihydrolipoamide succinyltransferase)
LLINWLLLPRVTNQAKDAFKPNLIFMARFEILMPKMGESIIEATITKWLKSKGDQVSEDDSLLEIATDKVDSEIPSPVEGILEDILYKEGDVVPVGKVIAVINIGGDASSDGGSVAEPVVAAVSESKIDMAIKEIVPESIAVQADESVSDKFYSPLVKSIAQKENISVRELDSMKGTGKDSRVTKQDILDYLKNRPAAGTKPQSAASPTQPLPLYEAPKVTMESGDEVFEMDRMRRMIADHMVMSKHISPHVTSFIDVDVTNIVRWREKIKESFFLREKEKITYTHIFIEASAQAIKDYPRINASVDGYNIIHRKKVNIGMATALPNGNLIVPVIKNANEKSLFGIIKNANDLAERARKGQLLPDDIQGGTFTITNFGTFDSLTGTPVINQPQVAILGVGAIRKQPSVVETLQGDLIGIRHIMILSLAYDHRVVDGALGGMFLKKMKDILEQWDLNRAL